MKTRLPEQFTFTTIALCAALAIGGETEHGDQPTNANGIATSDWILTAVPRHGSQPTNASEISSAVRLIEPMPAGVEDPELTPERRKMLRLAEWPSAREIQAHANPRDRTKEIPPIMEKVVIRQEGMPDQETLVTRKPGAYSPECAGFESSYWVFLIVKPKWIPLDLEKRFTFIQRDPACDSAVFCRYEIDGNAIQIGQSLRSIAIVIKPSKGVLERVISTNQIGPAVFKEFLNKHEEMAGLVDKKLATAGGLAAYTVDKKKTPWRPEASQNWWGSRLWYTDGEAVAVFFWRKHDDMSYFPNAADPWF